MRTRVLCILGSYYNSYFTCNEACVPLLINPLDPRLAREGERAAPSLPRASRVTPFSFKVL